MHDRTTCNLPTCSGAFCIAPPWPAYFLLFTARPIPLHSSLSTSPPSHSKARGNCANLRIWSSLPKRVNAN